MFSLGKRISELRLKKGLTQIDLAKGLCTPSMISQIESERARPSYKILSAIAQRLGVAIDVLLSDVELNMEAKSKWAIARAMMADKEYRAALPILQELGVSLEQAIPHFKWQQHLAECYLHTGQVEKAEALFGELEETARFHGDMGMMAHALQHKGLISLNRERYLIAIRYLEQAVEAIEQVEPPELLVKGELLTQLGQAFYKQGQMQESIRCYTEAALCFQGQDNLRELAHTYLQLAQSHRLLKQFDHSIDYSEQARAIFQGMGDYLITLQLKVQVAAAYGQSGREEECALAREWLPELHPAKGELLCTLGRIARQRDGVKEAIRQMEKATDFYKSAGMVREWEDTVAETARLYIEETDSEKAYTLLEEARMYVRGVMESRGLVL